MKKWWATGIQFECQGSGKCCTSRGQYGYVYLTREDRKRLAQHFNITTREFTKSYCKKEDGYFQLAYQPADVDCIFFKDKSCSVYEARPTQCRTWPFWPEVMSPKAWAKEVQSFCPGVGKGRIHSAEEVAKTIEIQKKSEKRL